MRKIATLGIAFSALLVCSTSFAATYTAPAENFGPYIGAQAGYADLNYSKGWLTSQTGFTSVDAVDDTGFAGRVYIGFDFNKYIAAELGYVYLPDVKFKRINGTQTDESFRQNIGDLLAKVSIPFNNHFSAYIKGGIAYVYRNNIKATLNGSAVSTTKTDSKVTAVLGAGLEYDFDSGFFMDATYHRYFARGDLRATDFIGAGVGFKFG